MLMRDVTGVSNMAILRRRFVFDLLHKLRTPLTTILSVLSMATSGRLDPTRVDFNEVLGMGAKQAERLTGLLSRLKDLFLLETGGLAAELSLQTVAVSSVVGQVVQNARGSAEEKFQTLIGEFPDEPVLAKADPDTLARAVEMVLANAIGFTPNAGEIRVEVKGDEDGVVIRIADNGPGVPAEELPIVFERFRRGTGPEIRSVEGEGIGLFLARHLLAAQGGTILLDSEYGEGTVVEIALPCAEEKA
jgi:signal transduction histidine kinase